MKIILFNPRIVFEMTIKWGSKDYINDNKREKGEMREYCRLASEIIVIMIWFTLIHKLSTKTKTKTEH